MQKREITTIPASIEDNLLRIGQEALTNVVKHASASRITIVLKAAPDGIELIISDDGQGITEMHKLGSYGLAGMKERTSRIKGELVIDNNPSGGSFVMIKVPLKAANSKLS